MCIHLDLVSEVIHLAIVRVHVLEKKLLASWNMTLYKYRLQI